MNVCYCCGKEVQIGEESFYGLHKNCFCLSFKITVPDTFHDVVARSSGGSERPGWEKVNSSFFHGAFRKYSARLGNYHYLLKVQEERYPELPFTEYVCNQIARSLKMAVPDFFLITFENATPAFVCKNFMSDYSLGNLVHIYRYLPSPSDYTCEGLLSVLEKEVGRVDDIERLITITLFDALIGNHDRHGRNLALIQSGSHKSLAPCYDNPSYLGIETFLKAEHEPRGAIATKETLEPTMKDYVKEWKRLGYGALVEDVYNRIDLVAIQGLIRASFMSPERQDALINLIHRRHVELKNAL